jgi:hypothetical protein
LQRQAFRRRCNRRVRQEDEMIDIRKMGESKLAGLEYEGTGVRPLNIHTVIVKVTNDCDLTPLDWSR